MIFADNDHKKFVLLKYMELQKIRISDVYYHSLIYLLGICKETRDNFQKIFDLNKGEINPNSLYAPWQTSTSVKITRLAFNLWNGYNFDSEYDIENNKYSNLYNTNEIFFCCYAPLFYEAIKIRYPEYTKC